MYRLLPLVALAVFLPGLAQAQPPLRGIIEEFCQEVDRDARDAQRELEDTIEELVDCAEDFEDCRSGLIGRDPVACLTKYNRCNNNANRDQQQICGFFQEELQEAYSDALRSARFRGGAPLERRFRIWLIRGGDTCLAPAEETATLCAGLTD